MRVIETFVTSVPREKIPDDAKWFMQDSDGEMKCAKERNTPTYTGTLWARKGVTLADASKLKLGYQPVSTDASETVVTREELMLAYDLVEQGYTLWFGGERPVDEGSIVDVVFVDGGTRTSDNFFWGRTVLKTASEIIAYRISRQAVEDADVVKYDSDSFGESERYNRGSIECIDIIKEMTADKSGLEAFCVGNVVKYLYRYKDKNGMADVIKARNYLNKMIEGDKK